MSRGLKYAAPQSFILSPLLATARGTREIRRWHNSLFQITMQGLEQITFIELNSYMQKFQDWTLKQTQQSQFTYNFADVPQTPKGGLDGHGRRYWNRRTRIDYIPWNTSWSRVLPGTTTTLINYVCKILSSNINALRNLAKLLPIQIFMTAYYCLVYSQLSYGMVLWGRSFYQSFTRLFRLWLVK